MRHFIICGILATRGIREFIPNTPISYCIARSGDSYFANRPGALRFPCALGQQ